MNTTYLFYALGGVAFTGIMLRILHINRRQQHMKCDCGKKWRVKKRYALFPLGGKRWEIYVFACCPCGNVRLIRSENKILTAGQIARRRRKYPEQFTLGADLMKQAGIIPASHSLTPFAVDLIRLKSKHRLPVPIGGKRARTS